MEATLSTTEGTRQRLAAILAGDAAGYSRLMNANEAGTLAALDRARGIFRSNIESHHGRVIDMAGDSVLAVFETATGAVSAALAVQQQLKALAEGVPADRRMQFRIGIHLGDLIEKADGSVYGNGVNIASRLQGLALPGGITASDAVRGAVRHRVAAEFEDLGEQLVKNIADPVRAFRVRGATEEFTGRSAGKPDGLVPRISNSVYRHRIGATTTAAVIALGSAVAVAVYEGAVSRSANRQGTVAGAGSDNPSAPAPTTNERSIAVLPFVDMSEKKDQEYFSDGLSEELIDHLARAADLKVIARTSSFQFKGKNEDTRVIAQKLGVAHLLEGSVRKAGETMRITAQLIKASDGSHLWSQTYERNVDAIFKVQNEIAGRVVQELKVAMAPGYARAANKEPNIEAYNLVLQGSFFKARVYKQDTDRAIELFQQAIKVDPTYALAWTRLGNAYFNQAFNGWAPAAETFAKAREANAQALRIDPNLVSAHSLLSSIHVFADRDWEAAKTEIERMRELDPGSQSLKNASAVLAGICGRLDETIELDRQQLISDPLNTYALSDLAWDLFYAGRLEESAVVSRKLLELNPVYAGGEAISGLTLLFLGQRDKALAAIEKETDEGYRLSALPIVYQALDRRMESTTALRELERKHAANGAYSIAEGHAYRGEVDAAFEWLDRAYRQLDPQMSFVKIDPLLHNLRSDPRYKALLVKLKLDGEHPC